MNQIVFNNIKYTVENNIKYTLDTVQNNTCYMVVELT